MDISFLFLTGRTSGVKFEQIPSLLAEERDNITIQCSHNDASLLLMLWYQQKSDSTDFSLITYAYGTGQPTNEEAFKDRFILSKENAQKGTLTISKVLQSDSAVYYCAASKHSAAHLYTSLTKTSDTLTHKHKHITSSTGFMFLTCLLFHNILYSQAHKTKVTTIWIIADMWKVLMV